MTTLDPLLTTLDPLLTTLDPLLTTLDPLLTTLDPLLTTLDPLRCSAVIDLPSVFAGDVVKAMNSLSQSIEAGERWKEQYKATARAVTARCPNPWDFDVRAMPTNIFTLIHTYQHIHTHFLIHVTL